MDSVFHNEWDSQTTLHPLGLAAIILSGIAMLMVPRKYAVWPMLAMACFIAPAQRIVIATLNFDLLRVMVLFGIARVMLRQEWRQFRWIALDTAMTLWTLFALFAFAILFASAEAIKYKAGILYEALGMYFLFRMLIRGWCDLDQVARGLAILSIPVAAAFVVEHVTGHNAFAFLGGVREITELRQGRLRCQGAFAHPILAGCFWASALPWIAAAWWSRGMSRWLVGAGVCMALLIVVLCASSTPVIALLLALLGAAFYPLRNHMRMVRWGLLLALIVLHLSMSKPVWHLMARVDLAGGSTGYQRYGLIDAAVKHADEWCLIGTSGGTAQWGPGLEDVTNFYVVQGLHGGLPLLALFLAIVTLAFFAVGRAVRTTLDGQRRRIVAWALGVSLFIHVMNFLAVSYFGQINMMWYLLLASVGSMSVFSTRPRMRIVRRIRRVREAGVHPTPEVRSPQTAAVREARCA